MSTNPTTATGLSSLSSFTTPPVNQRAISVPSAFSPAASRRETTGAALRTTLQSAVSDERVARLSKELSAYILSSSAEVSSSTSSNSLPFTLVDAVPMRAASPTSRIPPLDEHAEAVATLDDAYPAPPSIKEERKRAREVAAARETTEPLRGLSLAEAEHGPSQPFQEKMNFETSPFLSVAPLAPCGSSMTTLRGTVGALLSSSSAHPLTSTAGASQDKSGHTLAASSMAVRRLIHPTAKAEGTLPSVGGAGRLLPLAAEAGSLLPSAYETGSSAPLAHVSADTSADSIRSSITHVKRARFQSFVDAREFKLITGCDPVNPREAAIVVKPLAEQTS